MVRCPVIFMAMAHVHAGAVGHERVACFVTLERRYRGMRHGSVCCPRDSGDAWRSFRRVEHAR
jgi:hypothetical protein